MLPSEIHHQICQVYGDNAMSDSVVRKWVRMFNEGRENVHDEASSGRPSLVNDDWCVRSTIECVTTDFSQFLICPCTFLRFQGLCCMTFSVVIWVIGKCVHEGAQDAHRGAQKTACCMCFDISDALSQEGDGRLSHIVTGDETWVSHITSESKQQSLHWKHTGLLKRKKFKQRISTRKIMCTVFWDRQGILLVEFLPQGTTTNSAVYCEMLKKNSIQNKRRGMLSATILLHNDNT